MNNNKIYSNISKLWKRSRAAEWGVHIVIYILCGGFYGLTFRDIPTGFWQSYVHILLLQILWYPAGYLLNNYYDHESDRYDPARASRSLLKPSLNPILILLPLGFLWIFLKYHPATLLLSISLVVVAVAYSAKPIRLKGRGPAGVIAAALGQRLPFFWMLGLQYEVNLLPAAHVTIFMVIVGFLFILHHQFEDLEIDRLTGTRTWAVSRGRVVIYWTSRMLYVLLFLSVVLLWFITEGLRIGGPKLVYFTPCYTFLVLLTIWLFSYRYGREGRLRSLTLLANPVFIKNSTTEQRVLILGAGLAGMVAAIKLAEWGFEVEVHTPDACLGGLYSQVEGVHITRFDPQLTSEYLEIDLSKAFIPIHHERSYLYGRCYTPRRGQVWACRRSCQIGSLDRMLHKLACQRGVGFHFSSLIDFDIDRDCYTSILATGLSRGAYRRKNIPHRLISGYHAEKECYNQPQFICYKDPRLGKDFAYVASAGNRLYALLFSRDALPKRALEYFIDLLESTEGIAFSRWMEGTGAVPIQPNLFYNGDILAGTISGMIDPFYLSGISGALTSGKIAALALVEPERAKDEFNWLSRNWKLKSFFSDVAQKHTVRPIVYKSIAILNAAFEPVGVV